MGRSGLDGPPPDVDFESEVVVAFSATHGSSCPLMRMDEVIVDRERGRVYPWIVDPENRMACTADYAGEYRWVAAVERSELPVGRFQLGTTRHGEYRGGPLVTVDLRRPGATLGPDDIFK